MAQRAQVTKFTSHGCVPKSASTVFSAADLGGEIVLGDREKDLAVELFAIDLLAVNLDLQLIRACPTQPDLCGFRQCGSEAELPPDSVFIVADEFGMAVNDHLRRITGV